MVIKFLHNQFILPVRQVKSRYRTYENILFNAYASYDDALFVILYQYTPEEHINYEKNKSN